MRSSMRSCALGSALFAAFILTPSGRVAEGAEGLTITAQPPMATPGTVITFRIAPSVQKVDDVVDFDFGDGEHGKLSYTVGCSLLGGCNTIQHAYAGPGSFTVTGSGTISGSPVSGTVRVTITTAAETVDLYIPTGAHLTGYKGTNWRTDLEVHNPTSKLATYEIAVLLRNQENPDPAKAAFTLAGRQSEHYGDILDEMFHISGAAALRIRLTSGTVMAQSRTYNQLESGSFGQFVPAFPLQDAITSGRSARIFGLSHQPSLASGFRTNMGFVNASPAPITVEAMFYQSTGIPIGRLSIELKAYEFRQQDRIFEEMTKDPVDFGFVDLKTTTSGGLFFAYASVVDNITGDPIFVPAKIIE